MNHQDKFYFIYVITFIKSKSLLSYSQNDNNWIEKPASWKWMWSTARCCQAGGINVFLELLLIPMMIMMVMMVYLIRKHLNSQLLDGRGTSAFSKSSTKLNSLGLPIDHAYQWCWFSLHSCWLFWPDLCVIFHRIRAVTMNYHHKDHHHNLFTCAVSSSNSRRSLL